VTGHARARERQRGRPERHLQAVVLGQREEQAAGAVGVLFHEVEGAGVAVRDRAGLGQDQLEQRGRAAFGGQADADRVQLAELAAEARDLLGGVEIGEGVRDGAGEDRAARVGGQQRVPVLGPRAGAPRVDEADDPHVGAGRSIGALGVGEEDQGHRRRYRLLRAELPHLEVIGQERSRRPRGPRMHGVKHGPTHHFKVGLPRQPSQD